MPDRAALSFLAIGLTVCGLSGCFAPLKNLNVTHMGPPYKITGFDHGQLVGERAIVAMSPDEEIIARWLETNRQGWKPVSSCPPPEKVVKGEGFTLNFTKDSCYLYIPPDPKAPGKGKGKGKTEPIQLKKKLTSGDVELAQVLGGR